MTDKGNLVDENGKEYDDLLHKRCSQCLTIKPNEDFYKRYNGVNGVKPECKKCSSKYAKEWHWKTRGGIPENYDHKTGLYRVVCKYCNRETTSTISTKQYCSTSCQQKALGKLRRGKKPIINLDESIKIKIANGHYICLCSPETGGNDEYGACISAGKVPVSRQKITRFYYHTNPTVAIQQAVADHRQQIKQKELQS